MPPVFELQYLFNYLSDLGFVSSNGFGREVLSYQEIYCWSILMKVDLTIFEVEALRKLSTSYMVQSSKSEETNCPPPYVPEAEITVEQRQQVDSFFRSFVAKRKRAKS